MQKGSSKEQENGLSSWKEPAEQWIPREIRKRLTEIEALTEMLKGVLPRRKDEQAK
jgi:hypothetical protein